MVYTGVYSAPALVLAPCGLLSVAAVTNHTADDEQWIRGTASETNATPTINLLSSNNVTVTNGLLYDGSAVPRFYATDSFLIEITAKRTGGDLADENPLDGSLKAQVLAASQKAIETEFWEGYATLAHTPAGTDFLRATGKATVTTSGGLAPQVALSRLEQGIAGSPVGARGMIHMTPDVASQLGDHLILVNPSNSIDETMYAITRRGTLVVIGTGYTGNGPLGASGTAATATNKWMFGTSDVQVDLGAAEIITTSLAQGADTTKNDFVSVIQRPAAVHFDPSIWYAAQVTLA